MNVRHATFLFVLGSLPLARAQNNKPISLDEFMNATEIHDARIAPDGGAVVFTALAPDWQQNRFKEDLWLWTEKSGKLIPLTHSGHDSRAAWSPDGRYIAFVSDRPAAATKDDGDDDTPTDTEKDTTSRIWLIPVTGGEAFPLYRQKLDVNAFAWSADGASIDFSSTKPLSKNKQEAQKAEWKDVIRWREHERGDILLSVPIAAAAQSSIATPAAHQEPKAPNDKPDLPEGAKVLTHSAFEIEEIVPSPAGDQIAFETGAISHRLENPGEADTYLVPVGGGDARQLTHNFGLESRLTWSPDGKRLYFAIAAAGGSVEGPYRDVQGRIFSIDPASGSITRLGSDFQGSWEDFTVTPDNQLIAGGLTGIDQHLYRIDGAKYEAITTAPGNFSAVHAAQHGSQLIFTHSTINDPTQLYLAATATQVNQAKPLTSFNTLFTERAQVEWEPYRWKSEDGTPVEGMLIYPPGKKGAKNLRMLTLIHGGPADADGNHFGADWYDWATLAAANGWLVFRPNYRGSSGYGDAFMLAIEPHLVSAPGRDILSGVDALVKDGIADPNHLTIGGYSYGGYMTNWLITQTTRFKAAVTGAGAVEHAANWGNDDLTWDDAWYLSGTPWEKPALYQSEAALFQINKVTTPTHIVGGNADVRVSYLEQVLLERALQRLNVPHTLLVFPGEGHPLDKNPWHAYIKVREELKWLEKYGNN